ncbi:GNAT family N-acetyltransferase [Arachidicoccus soli]|uniref:GNAT family N-acetyltransferase n=2 Tax=Arachidicoccus soli TaxID=2341117 RepID=A0A386HS28_9BACT|nr:GNAT family N-acetyltransferase [Arachidicoccus soli]
MAGQRMFPQPYAEISAVCTHPDFRGRGLAADLIQSQIHRMQSIAAIPFLHVLAENIAAIKLYEKLGFEKRKEFIVYTIEPVL